MLKTLLVLPSSPNSTSSVHISNANSFKSAVWRSWPAAARSVFCWHCLTSLQRTRHPYFTGFPRHLCSHKGERETESMQSSFVTAKRAACLTVLGVITTGVYNLTLRNHLRGLVLTAEMLIYLLPPLFFFQKYCKILNKSNAPALSLFICGITCLW